MTFFGAERWGDRPWGGAQTAPWNPGLLGPKLWFSAGTIGQADLTRVYNWYDQSGNDHHLSLRSSRPSSQFPLYRVNVLDGGPAVQYDVDQSQLLETAQNGIAEAFDNGIGNGDFSVWFYIQPGLHATPTNNLGFWSCEGTGFGLATASEKLVLYSSGFSVLATSSQTVDEDLFHTIIVVRSSGTVRMYIDGTLDATTLANSTTFASPSVMNVGAGYFGSLDGHLRHFGMVDRALTAEERAELEAFMILPVTPIPPPPGTPYLVTIDWTNKGNYFGALDDVTPAIRHRPGIHIQRGKDSVRPRSPMMVPTGSFDLGNVDRTYSAENTSSPLFGLVVPDRPIQLSMDSNGAMVPIITGLIDEPEQQPARDERSVRINFLGKTALLKGDEISTILYQGIRTDEAIAVVLDAVDWPAGARTLASGDTVLNFWWLDNEDPWSALEELLETEGTGASMYESGDGFFHFENRNYRDMTARSMTSQGTFKDVAPDDELAYQHFSYVPGMKEIYNTVRITTVHRELTTLGSAWDAGEPLTLDASESRTVFATISDPWTNVQNVTLTTDYVVLSGSIASVTTSVVSATRVAITFTAGASGAIVVGPAADPASGPQLRAQVAAVVAEPEVSVTSVGDVVTRARTLSLTDKLRREISVGYAQSLCNVALAYYNDPRPIIAVEFQGISDERLEQIAEREVSDRINVEEPITGVDRDIHIEQINHQVNVGGREHRCALIGSAAPDVVEPGLWGVTTNGGWGEAKWTD